MNAFLETRQYTPDFPMSCFSAENNNFLAHCHMEVEMVYVLEGSIKVGVNREYKILNKGSMAIFSSTDIHYYDSANMNSDIIVLIFKPQIIGAKGNWPEKIKFLTPFVDDGIWNNVDAEIHEQIKSIFITILREVDSQYDYYQLYVRGKIIELCSLLLRYLPTYELNEHSANQELHDIERVQEVLKYLETRYSEDISLEALAKMVNLNPAYFSRMFKQFIGIGFKEYLSRIRIEKVENLMLSTDTPIIDICFQCGFNSVRTFNRTFKAIKGCTPSVLYKNIR